MAPVKPFVLLPAIDLRGGRVVRLRQGDFDRETIYGDAPVDVAIGFADLGAKWLHVVDLDGARAGSPQQAAVIAAIVEAVGDRLDVQVGGGLRDETSVASVLATGAARAVVGTGAIDDPRFAGRLVARHGVERIAVALDVRDGVAIGSGWRSGARGVAVIDAATRITEQGVATLVVTAIEEFGIAAVEAQASGCPVLAVGAGGALETVLPERTGVLVPEDDPSAMAEALRHTAWERFDRIAIREHAARFGPERFRTRLRAEVATAIAAQASR